MNEEHVEPGEDTTEDQAAPVALCPHCAHPLSLSEVRQVVAAACVDGLEL